MPRLAQFAALVGFVVMASGPVAGAPNVTPVEAGSR